MDQMSKIEQMPRVESWDRHSDGDLKTESSHHWFYYLHSLLYLHGFCFHSFFGKKKCVNGGETVVTCKSALKCPNGQRQLPGIDCLVVT